MTSLVFRCKIFLTFIFVLITTVSCIPLSESENHVPRIFLIDSRADNDLNYRLPNNTYPLRYDVYLETEVHKKDFNFTGRVVINFKALENTNSVTLHYRQIDIKLIVLKQYNNTVIADNATYTIDKTREFLEIKSPIQLLKDNQYILEIDYNGTLRSDNQGFYRSSYRNNKNEEVYIATTQLEQTEARHAFPCYDEPGIRAVYSIKIRHHNSYKSVSNMPIKESLTNGEYMITTFQDTPLMQTYLLAFVISDFDFVSNTTVRPQQTVYARQAAILNNDANFALDAGIKVIDAMEKHFGIKYTLDKLDQISIPDFYWGAMENWGLVTYREELLLYNKSRSTTKQLEGIIGTIAHEYTHQFFGNLVAPRWWDFTWLNEGFATLYAGYLSELVYPDMRFMDSFVLSKVHGAFEADSKEGIRPMTYYVQTPPEITALFDDIAYSKSGSVLRMFQEAFGVPVFTKGLYNYLNKMALKSASSDDLYEGLQTSLRESGSSLNVTSIMRTWEIQSGFPVITVTRNNDTITISQQRFLYENKTSKSLWSIPINYVVASSPNFTVMSPDFWMNPQASMSMKNNTAVKKWTTKDWLIFNIQQTGYYRVNYDDNLWKLLIKELNEGDFKKIHVTNRAQLIDDSLHLARAGQLNYSVAFDILNYLKNESDYMPLMAAGRGFTYFNRLISDSKYYNNFLRFIRESLNYAFTKLGVSVSDKDTNFDIHARNIAVDWACKSGLESCINATSNLLIQSLQGVNTHPDLQSVVYCNGLRNAPESTFNFILNKLEKSLDQGERSLLISSLGCSQNSTLLSQYLEKSLTSTFRLQERSRVLTAVTINGKIGLDLSLDFVVKNAQKMDEMIDPESITNTMALCGSLVSSENQFKKLETSLESLVYSKFITTAFAASVKKDAQENLNVRMKIDEQLEVWLTEHFKGSSSTITLSLTLLIGAMLLYILQ